MNKEQFKVVGHTLGINTYHSELSDREKDKMLPDEFYRNYFCAGNENHHDFKTLEGLEQLGIMQRWEQMNNIYFCITDLGIISFRKKFEEDITSKFKPISKGKQRYHDYIDSECCEDFGEFLGIELPEFQYPNYSSPFELQGAVRMISAKYECVKGEWSKTKKEAKESYKEALKRYKQKLKEDK